MSDIQIYKQQAQMIGYDEIEKLAKAMVASGYFQDVKSVAQAIVKIKAGQEFGFGAFASMNGIYIINGRPAAGANLMASAIKSSGRYDYKVKKLDDKECIIEFYENGQKIGESPFTIEDARKAGTKNLEKFPRNMLFARAMSNGVRWFCPDVLNGNVIYTPEELGAEVDQDGNVLIIQEEHTSEIEPEEITETAQAADNIEDQAKISQEEDMTLEEARLIKNSQGTAYGELSSKQLIEMSIEIGKALRKTDLTAEERAEYQKKFKAIGILLKAKSEDEKLDEDDEIESKTENKRPYAPNELKKALVLASLKLEPAPEKDRQKLAAILSQFTENEDERHKLQKFLFGAESLKDVEPNMIAAGLRWINPKYENGEYLVSQSVREELEAVYKQIIGGNSMEDSIL